MADVTGLLLLLPAAAAVADEEPREELAEGDLLSCVVGGVSEGVRVVMSEGEERVGGREGVVTTADDVELLVDSDVSDSCARHSFLTDPPSPADLSTSSKDTDLRSCVTLRDTVSRSVSPDFCILSFGIRSCSSIS